MKLATLNPRLLVQLGQVWVATVLANALLYVFHVAVGRSLSPADYGLFGALFGIIYLSGALSNGVRVSIAKFVANSGEENGGTGTGPLVTSAILQMLLLGGAILLAFGLASPLIRSYLHSGSLAPIIVTGVVVGVSILMPVTQGALQGAQKFRFFAGNLLMNASSRLLLGLAALGLKFGITGVLAAIGVASLLATALGLAMIRPPATVSLKALPVGTFARLLVPTVIGSLAIFIPTSADVIIVRHFFSPVDAGLYTAASILGRIVLFLPMAVSLVLFPKIVHHWALGSSTRGLLYRGLGLTALLSGGVTLVFIFLPKFTLNVALGGDYDGAEDLVPLYAGAMFLFSLAVVFLYYHLATGQTSYLYLLLLPHIVLELALIYVLHQSLTQVILVLLGVNASLAVSSLVFTAVVRVKASGGSEAEHVSSLAPRGN